MALARLFLPCVKVALAALVFSLVPAVARGETPAVPSFSAEQLGFFEREVKPILKANCVSCHGGEKKVQSGLYLTSREGVLKGGENGPAVSLEKPEESTLLSAINYETYEMPPKGKLPQAQIEVLTKWVKMGLPWPEGESGNLVHRGPPVVDDAARSFWSFRPVVRPAVPMVKNAAWVRNPIDAFVLAKVEEKGLRPAEEAEWATLVRRVSYSVTGLPPETEGETGREGEGEKGYAAMIERLLASRHYGEHWGRHWLDLVRYAETNSFERDNPKPFVWRYRDYVIRSFNEDKPYDQFIREQLAGDELEQVTPETIIATGYYRLGLWDDEPADPLLAYYDGLDDILATTGQTFLGLTVNCARCHDHKIDPFPQRDYYKLLAFFHGIRHYGERSDTSVAAASLRSIATPDEERELKDELAAFQRELEGLEQQLREMEAAAEAKLSGGERDDFKYPRNRIAILRKHIGELLTQEQFDRYGSLRRQLERKERDRPRSAAQALAVKEEKQPRETFVLVRGNPQSHGEKVEPGFPAVLGGEGAARQAGPTDESSGRRRVLAEWIASPSNPLTARVIVNRVWQYHFGRGLVRSSSNFGYQGTPPTHPELLDWLAHWFTNEANWSLKKLHRLILASSTYRQSLRNSEFRIQNSELQKIDPENDLLSHFDLRRLGAEELRDSILAACGNLNLKKQNGPSVYPPIPAEVLAGQSKPGYGWHTSGPEDAAARSVYVHIKRSLALPILAAFDAPDPDAPCPVRFATTQPTQALSMMNSGFMNAQAGLFAKFAVERAGSDPAAQMRFVLGRVMQRAPTEAEVERGLRFMATQKQTEKASEEESLRRFCLVALNLNEFAYVE